MKASVESATPYRPDIDGLRAVAVLLVVAFHAFPGRLPGGFVGVDVFFVISGFLISGLILRDLREGTFSVAGFYVRRVRRIFPALALLLVVGLVAGYWTLAPSEFVDLGWHTAAGAGFAANLALWAQSDYFASAARTKPLLHLWSLGIEEQFYLLWPLTLAALYRWAPRPARGIAAIGLASFAVSVWMTRAHPTGAYYCPATRFWELLAGAVLACGATATVSSDAPVGSRDRLRRGLRHGLSAAGLLAVLAAALAFDASVPFPGWRAAVPVAGTAALIACGPGALPNRVLAHRAPVAIGLISYPLYLWHWPILAILPSLDLAWAPRGERLVRLAAVASAFVAAWLTYRFVESPVRRRRTATTAQLCWAMVVPFVGGLSVLGWGAVTRRPANPRQEELAVEVKRVAEQAPEQFRTRRCLLEADQDEAAFDSECRDDAERHPRTGVLLWGDSHAAQLYGGLRSDVPAVAQLTMSMCPPVVGYASAGRPSCRRVNDWILAWVRDHRPDAVVLAASWIDYDGYAAVAGTLRELGSLGIGKVVLVGPVASFREPVPGILARESRDGSTPERLPNRRLARLWTIDSELAGIAQSTGAEYFSPLKRMCDRSSCLVALEGRASGLVTWDTSHLTPIGARFVAADLVTQLRGDGHRDSMRGADSPGREAPR